MFRNPFSMSNEPLGYEVFIWQSKENYNAVRTLAEEIKESEEIDWSMAVEDALEQLNLSRDDFDLPDWDDLWEE